MAETLRNRLAAPGIPPRSGLLLFLLLTACAGLQSEPEGPTTVFGPGRTESTTENVVQVDGSILYDDDPFASPLGASEGDSRVTDLTGGAGTMAIPFDQLTEINPLETEGIEAGVLERSSELSLTMLRARSVADELSRTSRIVVDPGPHTFGDRVRVRLESRNPFGELLELLPSDDGLVVEMSWEIVRWLPIQGYDRVLRRHWFKLPRWYSLDPDQDWWEETELPLELDGESGGLWTVRLAARIRCAGARLGESELPVHEVRFRSGALLALPPGWKQYQSDPLGTLDRLADISGPGADRHVLVCAALLQGRDQRRRGLDLLLDHVGTLGQEDGISEHRAITFCTALQWLTGLEDKMSNYPPEWIAWRKQIQSRPNESSR